MWVDMVNGIWLYHRGGNSDLLTLMIPLPGVKHHVRPVRLVTGKLYNALSLSPADDICDSHVTYEG